MQVRGPHRDNEEHASIIRKEGKNTLVRGELWHDEMDTLREDMAAIGGLVGCFVMRVCEWAAGVDDVFCLGLEGLAALLVV